MTKTSAIVRTVVIILLLAVNVGCDQMSKQFVRSNLAYDHRIMMLDDHVMFTRVENRGAFLSLGQSLSQEPRFIILVVIPFIALIVGLMLVFTRANLSRSTVIAIGFIVGGGLGNLYDRYIYGSVTDFMHINFYIFRTGIFNMADVSIMTGAFIILISSTVRWRRGSAMIVNDNY
jgi:signal peptidase II